MVAAADFRFARGFREQPWCWDAAPPETPERGAGLPGRVDALVIGAGLNAAMPLAGAGRECWWRATATPTRGCPGSGAG